MKTRTKISWLALPALITAGIIGIMTAPLPVSCATQATATTATTNYLPEIKLTDQDGKTMSLASLKGRPVLVSFIHASCKGVCELMTAKMKSVAKDLGNNGTKVVMVSITTDPAEDGPTQLKEYAEKQGVNERGFVLLTGKPATVRRVLGVYGVNQRPGENEMTHVFELFLIGPDGHEVRHYHGLNIDAAKVAGDIQQTLAHSPA